MRMRNKAEWAKYVNFDKCEITTLGLLQICYGCEKREGGSYIPLERKESGDPNIEMLLSARNLGTERRNMGSYWKRTFIGWNGSESLGI